MGAGGELPEMYNILHTMANARGDAQNTGSISIVVDGAWSEDDSADGIPAFCATHGWEWGETFFGSLPVGGSFPSYADPGALKCKEEELYR
jgi:hypothetical protein